MITKVQKAALVAKMYELEVFTLTYGNPTTAEFLRGCRHGVSTAMQAVGISQMHVFDIQQAADNWASENCPAVKNHTECVKGCNACGNVAKAYAGGVK